MHTLNSKIAERIAEHPFLRTMSEKALETISGCAVEKVFDAGQILFREGEPAGQCYLIQRGRVALEWREQGQLTQLQTVGAGEVLGWSWLFPPFISHFQARTLEPTSVIALDGAHLLVVSNESPRFGYELMSRVAQVLIQRLQATRKQLQQIKIGPARVCEPA